MKRDPRVDPQPGDELLWNDWIVHIERVRGGIVHYRYRLEGERDFRANKPAAYLQQYLKWAKDGEVLNAAD